MKRFSEQLHKQSQTVKLNKSEQADLRGRLVSYMEYHPLPASMKEAVVPVAQKPVRSPLLAESFTQYSIPFQSLFKFGSVAAVVVLMIVPVMAERSVPGDTLYAVKVQFNEEVRSSLTWGGYEKVEWETQRLNRRIDEARLLADEGLLTDEMEAAVAAAVKEHSDSAKREIEVLRASDADEATIATIAFDSSLEVQAQAFEGRQAIGGGEDAIDFMSSGNLISAAIDESLKKASTSEQADVPSYDKLMVRIELNTTRVRELRDSLIGLVEDQELKDVTRRIDDIDRAISKAILLAESPETELDARAALVDVLTRTQKLIVFMSDLEVRKDVAIETVVPVVLTDDEMSAERTNRTQELQAAIIKLNAVLEGGDADELNEKLVDTYEKLVVARQKLSETDDYKAFVTQSDSALALAKDALSLVEQQQGDVAPPEEGTAVASSTDDIVVPTSTSSAASTTDSVGSSSTDSEIDTEQS